MMRKITTADYLVEFLIANGVTEVFGYQGGMIAYIFDSLGKYRDKINYYSCATEQGAALAAIGYSQATGKLGVAISTSGPGFTNLLTGMADAWFDSVPVLFISGNVNTKDKKRNMPIRQLGFQEIQAADMAKTITKKAIEIELETDFVKCLDDLYCTAMSDRRGPVYMDLPINVCRETVMVENIVPVQQKKETWNCNIEQIFDILARHKRPVIIAGAGIKEAGKVNEFRDFVNCIKLPVVTTLPAIDVLPSNSRYMMGYIGGTARREAGIVLQNADCVISLGTRLCSKQIGHNLSLFAPNADVFVRVDIDEAEFVRRIKENEIDVHCSLEYFFSKTSDCIKDGRLTYSFDAWNKACEKVYQLLQGIDITDGNQIVNYITKNIPKNSNILLDVGKNLTYAGQSAVINCETSVYMSAGLGTMGYAIPAAIGAYIGNKKPTYVITGDGGAQMNIQELNTIVKNGLPIKIIVLNNRALGNIRIFQKQYLEERYVATSEKEGDYYSCDFMAISEAYKMKSYGINGVPKEDESVLAFVKEEGSSLLEITYDDCDVLPGIVAGGDFLKQDSGIQNSLIEKIQTILNGV